jgi:Protein of unknown function (DUF3551)
MRMSFLALAAIVAGIGASSTPAAAAPSYPWCARYSSTGGECAFNTFEQCLEDVSGIGGFCQANPSYTGRVYNYAPRRQRPAY